MSRHAKRVVNSLFPGVVRQLTNEQIEQQLAMGTLWSDPGHSVLLRPYSHDASEWSTLVTGAGDVAGGALEAAGMKVAADITRAGARLAGGLIVAIDKAVKSHEDEVALCDFLAYVEKFATKEAANRVRAAAEADSRASALVPVAGGSPVGTTATATDAGVRDVNMECGAIKRRLRQAMVLLPDGSLDLDKIDDEHRDMIVRWFSARSPEQTNDPDPQRRERREVRPRRSRSSRNRRTQTRRRRR